MKTIAKNDLILTFLLALSYIIYIAFFSLTIDYAFSTPLFNLRIDNNLLDAIYLVLMFVSSGYALLSLLYPEDKPKKLLKKPILLLMLSSLLTILVTVILRYSPLMMDLRLLIVFLSAMTMIFSLLTYRRRLESLELLSSPEAVMKNSESIISVVQKYRETIKDSPEKLESRPMKTENSTPLVEKRPAVKDKINFKAIPLDFLAIIILALLSIVTVSIPLLNESILKYILGVIFVFIIPGYALLAFLFPRKQSLEKLERLGLAVILSLVLASIVGLMLNYTPLGIRLRDLLLVAAILSLIFIIIAYLRIKNIPKEGRYTIKS